ncbi:MAG: cysteine synthase family protein [Pseudomonadota bacterium]|nr:cysteine synthase family protein [Pseudomonadota bacterium]
MLVDRIGNTPLVRLRHILDGVVPPEVEIWAKLEWFNPGGSVKDRAAWAMIRDAESSGRLLPGMRLLDSSSGNTGIAYGMIAAARGHALTLCLPANANRERKKILRAFGVEVIETDPLEGSDGAIRRARELVAEHPDLYLYLDQYSNAANWRAHYETTAPEIWRDTGGRVTHWVSALGTTGTFTGTSRRLKEYDPRILCVSVQPDSPFHGLEGLKHLESAIVPAIYDASLADADLGAPTEASILLMRRLAREEGMLVGVSSGAALWGAIEVARQLDRGVVVTLFPDSGERYLSEEHLWP